MLNVLIVVVQYSCFYPAHVWVFPDGDLGFVYDLFDVFNKDWLNIYSGFSNFQFTIFICWQFCEIYIRLVVCWTRMLLVQYGLTWYCKTRQDYVECLIKYDGFHAHIEKIIEQQITESILGMSALILMHFSWCCHSWRWN